MSHPRPYLVLLVAGLLGALAPRFALAQSKANVAVFNFQLKSATPEWVWLEKFLSDQITTDFVRSGMTVLARDEMQLVAQQVSWVPEMATADAKVMGRLRQELKIENLVTGVCIVEGNQVQVTGQVVAVADRKEVFRWSGSAPASEVLNLQKRLSAELLAWFTKGKPEQILEKLPVWTRSIPAARALYQGMDLYDQGRYAEAWLKFRQASREDGSYVEAVYWVGKMYYFLNRYEHARRSLERFVYMDAFHPRSQEAVLEYIHTYEALDAPPDVLLELYTSLRKRFPPGLISEGLVQNWITEEMRKEDPHLTVRLPTLDDWMRLRTAHVLGELGRHREAALLTGPALQIEGDPLIPLCWWNLLQDSAKSGRIPEPNLLTDMDPQRRWNRTPLIYFDQGRSKASQTYATPQEIVGKSLADKWTSNNVYKTMFLEVMVPPGNVFRSLTVIPRARGQALLTVELGVPGAGAYAAKSAEATAAEGIRFDNVPRTGMIGVTCRYAAHDDGRATVEGVALEAAWAKIEHPGSIYVDCQERSGFRVDVDGVYARTGPGLIGPVEAGKHTLRFYPADANLPCEPWTGQLAVREGNTASLRGRLPWKRGGPWEGWQGALVGRDYAGHGYLASRFGRDAELSAPSICADEEGIRIVWSVGGDLWLSTSADGNTYSLPRKVVLPVSSGWSEGRPRLLRDENGRFVMVFASSRDAQHRRMLYATWSRDLEHWSAPCLVTDSSAARWDLSQDGQGRLLLAHSMKGGIEVLASRDALQWTPCGKFSPPRDEQWVEVNLLRRDDGRCEALLASLPWDRNGKPGPLAYSDRMMRRINGGGSEWSPEEPLANVVRGHPLVAHAQGRTMLFLGSFAESEKLTATELLAEGPGGRWQISQPAAMPLCRNMDIAYCPRWGYMLAWMAPTGADGYPLRAQGPYVMRGADLARAFGAMRAVSPEFAGGAGATPSKTSTAPAPVAAASDDANVPLAIRGLKGIVPNFGNEEYARPVPEEVGRLAIVPAPPAGWFAAQKIELPEQFKKPRPGDGTIGRDARVFHVKSGPVELDLAVDSNTPDAKYYEVLRLDPTCKGDFRAAPVIRLYNRGAMQLSGVQSLRHEFVANPLDLSVRGRKVSVRLQCFYKEEKTSPDQEARRTAWVLISADAVGKCQFGDAVREVCIPDTLGTFIPNRKTELLTAGGLPDLGKWAYLKVNVGGGQEETGYYGHPIVVDGKLWEVRVSDGGDRVSATEFAGPAGKIHIAHDSWKAWVVSDRCAMVLRGGAEPVPVPAGRYWIQYYQESGKAGSAATVKEIGFGKDRPGYAQESPVEVAAGKTAEVTVGSPVVLTITSQVQGRTVRFRLTAADAAGRQIVGLGDGRFLGDWAILDADGKQAGVVKIAWTDGAWQGAWTASVEMKGTFTLSVPAALSSVPLKSEKVTFTLGG